MSRRRFFGMLAGVIGALALPVPKVLKAWLPGEVTMLVSNVRFRAIPISIVDKLTELEVTGE